MKIALLGYGRMGKTIEQIAIKKGHEIVLKVDESTKNYDITLANIAIDFSIPSVAFENIANCLNNNVPVVSGTTGWLDKFDEAKELCNQNNGGFIYASNFSLGVNIFFELNEFLAKMMANLNQYQISMEEIHHTKKLDEPSGTAITLAQVIIKNTDKNNWALNVTNNESEIPIIAKRIPNIPGTHSVAYTSEVDTIEIKHTAHNRDGFALGALIAAEWLVDKKGIFTMKDVLGLQ
ncbi:MAG: 4-hydroxy-tetrahydrodipicolinate reductase [Lutibacter sp.]|uniref:4-hydroxy-tetrahydrodipicolinate reductase n=1 Tax=Lutibacter sp. TaxID=1925666 RepID=UPI0018280938|nr:4-hydroxy-tetrahydrodipicolinate reductase [Lutibacter sp.]MBT8316321.1 4-hydroxy-tetrahydrodipicolinate reductase [Lutibacter sp.]NNJ57181.1 4-hydroxy-tetrahydrodipicolinate reductase [Lutibacter sp.]